MFTNLNSLTCQITFNKSTRKHYSRMRTARLLTVVGAVCAGVGVCPGVVSDWGGVCPRAVSGGCPGGVSLGGVTIGRVCQEVYTSL